MHRTTADRTSPSPDAVRVVTGCTTRPRTARCAWAPSPPRRLVARGPSTVTECACGQVSANLKYVRIAWSLLVGLAFGAANIRVERFRVLDFSPFDAPLEGRSPAGDADLGRFLRDASLAQIHDLMVRGELSAEALTLYFLARIRERDEDLRSMIELNPDALLEAGAADRRRSASGRLGMLDGIPVTLKDNIETTGPMRTTAGAMVMADHVAEHDAEIVTALRRAGAVILGKANLSELTGSATRTPGLSAVGGQTVNPYGEDFSPGGSSSGSAVSVAAGLCVASVGTETSGSLIAPAAYNGVRGDEAQSWSSEL